VHAADRRERHVARPQLVPLAVELALRPALQEQVRLLERVVVPAGRTVRVVVDHEHRGQIRAEVRVDHHLHRDAAVDQQRGAHAGRHGEQFLALPAGVHVPGLDVPVPPVARVARVHRLGLRRVGGRQRRHQQRVVAVGRAGLRREHVGPARRFGAGVVPFVRHADRDQPVVARAQEPVTLRGARDHLARKDEGAFLVRVHVRRYGLAGRQFVHAEAGVYAGSGVVHDGPPSVPGALPGPRRRGEPGVAGPPHQVSGCH
jgi:hypothetical protein